MCMHVRVRPYIYLCVREWYYNVLQLCYTVSCECVCVCACVRICMLQPYDTVWFAWACRSSSRSLLSVSRSGWPWWRSPSRSSYWMKRSSSLPASLLMVKTSSSPSTGWCWLGPSTWPSWITSLYDDSSSLPCLLVLPCWGVGKGEGGLGGC